MGENGLFCSFPRWGKAGMGASSANGVSTSALAAEPHPTLPPKGEGARHFTPQRTEIAMKMVAGRARF